MIRPVEKSYSNKVTNDKDEGSFWENRGDRHHCGLDIYALKNSEVKAIESGSVIKTGVFTSPKKIEYWNKTFYIDVKTKNDIVIRYAELAKINVKEDYEINKGKTIGLVGQVLNKELIDENSPEYIQKLAEKGNISMLHLEVYKIKAIDVNSDRYLGGNWFGDGKPCCLLNPKIFLKK